MQYKALIAGLMASAVTAAPTPQEDIVGGTAAAAGEFPYIVSLQSGGSHFCGGSLVDSRTVITAAHCTVGQSVSSLTIRAGSLQRSSGGTVVRVSSIKSHPNYASGGQYNNDIAVWKLATAIPTSSTIGYVALPAANSDPAAGSTVSVAGWGTTSSGGSSLPAALRRVDVPIVARSTCRNNYSAAEVTDNMVCAGLTAGGKDSCQGDSGGPLVNASKQLIGVVSWGYGCASPNQPGVYSRVSTLLSFVNANLG
ncbi:extracellular trypsin protease [Boeremia exigua]|uniref:extracellular trypsin protease n=1 Tax=Boeremia exigua TaxID=749465 RepID=UPI001E8CEE11|nr:extracellular trypsin protease [Boeremia exigua]KAH6629012.1 extracellular trypsin protease [Boeremia exigua]